LTPQPDDPEGYHSEMAALRRYVTLKVDSISEGSGNIYENESASATAKLTNWLLTVLSCLVVAEMIGGVNLYAKVEALQTTMQLIVEGKIVIVRVP